MYIPTQGGIPGVIHLLYTPREAYTAGYTYHTVHREAYTAGCTYHPGTQGGIYHRVYLPPRYTGRHIYPGLYLWEAPESLF